MNDLDRIIPSESSTIDIHAFRKDCFEPMNDDFNSPVLIARLFEGVKYIHQLLESRATLTSDDLQTFRNTFHDFVFEVLGLRQEETADDELTGKIMNAILKVREKARERKNYEISDLIRDELQKIDISIKDTRDGVEWSLDV